MKEGGLRNKKLAFFKRVLRDLTVGARAAVTGRRR